MASVRHLLPASVLVALVGLSASACASHHTWSRHPQGPAPIDARAFDAGYRHGYDDGVRDGRRGRPFDYARHGEYRDADRGYRGYGSRGAYRRAFRDGFMSGYNDGYRRYARADRDRGWRDHDRDGEFRGPRGGWSAASDHGYRDGYAQGRDDARDGDRYDPIRSRRYREGDSGYQGRYGSRDEYKREYRSAFQDGYRQGYAGGRRG